MFSKNGSMYSVINCRQERVKIKIVVVVVVENYNEKHSLTTLLSCSSLEDPSPPSSLPLSAVFSSSRNSHRHCTGSTSSDPSDDWTRSASHGILWDAPWKKAKHIKENTMEALSTDTPGIGQLYFQPSSQHLVWTAIQTLYWFIPESTCSCGQWPIPAGRESWYLYWWKHKYLVLKQ